MSAVAVVIASRDRRERLLATLDRLAALPERPEVVVVDDGSADGTAPAVRAAHPGVRVIVRAGGGAGAARNAGVRLARTPYVAFCDDDSWWAAGALARAAEHLDRHRTLGLVAARILVGPEGRPDPTCALMAGSPLRGEDLPGPRVLGFLACGAVVRRSAFLQAGGFCAPLGAGGEEELLALDLEVRGWRLAYAPDVVAHHHPQAIGPRPRRETVQRRNALWCAWLRRPARVALRRTLAAARPGAARALAAAAPGLPWILRARRVVPPRLEDDLRRLERAGAVSGRRRARRWWRGSPRPPRPPRPGRAPGRRASDRR